MNIFIFILMRNKISKHMIIYAFYFKSCQQEIMTTASLFTRKLHASNHELRIFFFFSWQLGERIVLSSNTLL